MLLEGFQQKICKQTVTFLGIGQSCLILLSSKEYNHTFLRPQPLLRSISILKNVYPQTVAAHFTISGIYQKKSVIYIPSGYPPI